MKIWRDGEGGLWFRLREHGPRRPIYIGPVVMVAVAIALAAIFWGG